MNLNTNTFIYIVSRYSCLLGILLHLFSFTIDLKTTLSERRNVVAFLKFNQDDFQFLKFFDLSQLFVIKLFNL